MKKCLKIILVLIFIACSKVLANDYLYILNDDCINDLYVLASEDFNNTEVMPIRDSRGIILRFEFMDLKKEFFNANLKIYKKIEYFLAKIENPVIIEVHIETFLSEEFKNLKKWEVSTIMANNIEAIITKPVGLINQNRINSIGYGEFLPAKNTSNNGGKKNNRVDIIVLCNVSGE
jgi:hypothetical protein